MDITSVTSSSGAYSANITGQATQTQQSEATEPAEKRLPDNERQEAAPRPVVNTDGQKTGTIINVTA